MKEHKLHLRQEQLEKLQELGARLRQFRTEQSISIEEMATQTRIQVRLLNAIEEGKLERLPEPVYIQGFIKRFAEALGLDGEEFASSFPIGNTQAVRPYWRQFSTSQLRPVHLYLLYILLVMGAVSGLSSIVKRSAVQVISNEDEARPPVQQLTPDSSSAHNSSQQLGSLQQTARVSASSASKPVQVDVTLKDQSWLRIVADGKTEFEGTLPEGTHRTWVANEKLIVRAGNAGGVLVEFNDQSAKQMGEPGAVEELTFAANPRS